MIYDCVIINDEIDLLEMRLKIIGDFIDKIVIVECDKTFSGKDKIYNFEHNKDRFKRWGEKIIYHKINLNYNGNAWHSEFFHRNSIKDALVNLNDDDIVMISDVDEIPNPEILMNLNSIVPQSTHLDFCMDLFYYFVNKKCDWPSDCWWGTQAMKYSHFKNRFNLSGQDVRENRTHGNKINNSGWHFSYLGGVDSIRKKIESFAHTELDHDHFKSDENINSSLETGKDLYNRDPGVYGKHNLIDMNEEFPENIVNILKEYPKFISK